eukprot:RCo048259
MESLNKPFVLSILRQLLEAEQSPPPPQQSAALRPAVSEGPEDAPADGQRLDPVEDGSEDELSSVRCGRASTAEVARIEGCKLLWDLSADPEVARYLCGTHAVPVLVAVAASANA